MPLWQEPYRALRYLNRAAHGNEHGYSPMPLLKHTVRALMLLSTIILSVACSTLELKVGYVLQDKSPEARLPIPDGDLGLGFQPATRLYSFGVLGAPVIPTVAHIKEPTEMNLSLTLTLHADHEFSFARSLCV